MSKCNCVIDCMSKDNLCDNFLTLNLYGKYVMQWVIDAAISADVFSTIFILTNSKYVTSVCSSLYGDKISVISDVDSVQYPICMLSGRAPMLKARTLTELFGKFQEGCDIYSVIKSNESENVHGFWSEDISETSDFRYVNVFVYKESPIYNNAKNIFYLSDTEAVIINTKNDFELALILMQKEKKAETLKGLILNRIEEKHFSESFGERTIGLIGHSQFDNWDIQSLCGYKVINYGIRGINSFEYTNCILEAGKLQLSSDLYLVMHGTNDIVYDRSYEEIFNSIMDTVSYIKTNRPNAQIFFLCCAHINGRLDRSNFKINEFNKYMAEHMLPEVEFVTLAEMDDEFGNLKMEYTYDGLHFNKNGYDKLQEIVEEAIKRKGLE